MNNTISGVAVMLLGTCLPARARQAAEDLAEIVVPGTRRDYFARIEAFAQK